MGLCEWVIGHPDKLMIAHLAEKWDMPFLTTAVLSTRGFKKEKDAKGFIYGYNDYSNPMDFVDMDKLVNRVRRAIDNFEKICVYGDYDADGITATSLFYSYLESKEADVMYYIPQREGEGYGLSSTTIDKLKEYGVKLIITVDNGVSAVEEVDYANSLGIDVVITDHHRVPEKLPNAVAIVNPYREDCTSKFKTFSGVGVAFKAICAIEGQDVNFETLMNTYGDLVTIGTVGDSIELVGETRDIVRKGCEIITKAKRDGVKVLLEMAGIYGRNIDSTNIAFGVVPRINASGRMGSASRAVRLLLGTYSESAELCAEINEENDLRKTIESEILLDIEKFFQEHPERKFEKIIIAEGKDWHFGVLGIVASRITKMYGKPSILITSDGENAKGSCRSIEGFSIHEAVTACSEYLSRFGGHPMAAGINLKTENIEGFRKAILKYADKFGEMPFSKINIECRLNPRNLSPDMAEQIELLKPFGNGNREPVFGLFSMYLKDIRPISGGKHLRLILSYADAEIAAMYFNHGFDDFLYRVGDIVDLAVTFHRNEYAGVINLSIFISEINLSGVDLKDAMMQRRVYEKFKRGEELDANEINILLPDRNDFAEIYNYLRENEGFVQRPDVMSARLKRRSVSVGRIYVILDVMAELGIADVSTTEDNYEIRLNNLKNKVDLKSSNILSKLVSVRGGE